MKKFFVFSLSLFLIYSCKIEEKETLPGQMLSRLNKLPTQASLIGYINIAKIKTSPLYDLFEENAEDNLFHDEEYRQFTEQTGLDIKKDINEIYLATLGIEDHSDFNGVFIALGEFQPEKIISYIIEQDEPGDLQSEPYNEFTIYHINDGDMYFCFIDDQTLIGGKRNLVIEALKPDKDGKEPILLPQIRELKYKTWAWAVIQTEPFLDQLDHFDISDRFQGAFSVLNADLAVKFSDEFYFQSNLNCTDKNKAETLRDAVKGAVAAAKLSMGDDRDAIDTLNKIDVNVEDKKVITSGDMTRSDLEKLISKRYTL